MKPENMIGNHYMPVINILWNIVVRICTFRRVLSIILGRELSILGMKHPKYCF